MEPYVLKHLDAWLDRHVREDEREEARERMLAAVQEDPLLLDWGWSRVWTLSKRLR